MLQHYYHKSITDYTLIQIEKYVDRISDIAMIENPVTPKEMMKRNLTRA